MEIAAGAASTSLRVKGTSTGTNWSGRIVAGGPSNVFVMGQYNNHAWLGGHNSALSAWADLYINPEGSSGKKVFIGAYNSRENTIFTVDNATGNSYFMNGNVGIGTTDPDANLDIYEAFFRGFKFWTDKYINYHANITQWETMGTRSGVLQFWHPEISQGEEVGGGWTQIRCGGVYVVNENDGYVKIQLNSWGDAKFKGDVFVNALNVNGKITAEEIEVIRDVPDFDHVFYDSYRLPSLKEVEQFVNTNKHLPDIPSSQEFKENGYKVGEMDGLLLKKIEELTLYVIEQQKTIENLQTKLDKIEKMK